MSEIPRIFVEAYVETADQARAAVAAGADRLELCGPGEGGLTPSRELVDAVLRSVTVPVHAMVRPRSGNFVYDEAEFAAMQRDAIALRATGVAGLVFGVLCEDGSIDVERMTQLIDIARPLRVCCHRAFDATPDPAAALETLLRIGMDLVLTSGHAARALDGRAWLARHVQHAGGRLTVMSGGGVRGDHVQALVAATGVRAVHARGTDPDVIAGIVAALRGPRAGEGSQ